MPNDPNDQEEKEVQVDPGFEPTEPGNRDLSTTQEIKFFMDQLGPDGLGQPPVLERDFELNPAYEEIFDDQGNLVKIRSGMARSENTQNRAMIRWAAGDNNPFLGTPIPIHPDFAQDFMSKTILEIAELFTTPGLPDSPFDIDPEWVTGINYTQLELWTIDSGLHADNAVYYEANQALYEQNLETQQEVINRLTKQNIRLEMNPWYLELVRLYGADIGDENLQAFTWGMQYYMDEPRANALFSEMIDELNTHGDLYRANPKKMDEFIGRNVLRSAQLSSEFAEDLAVHDRSWVSSFGNFIGGAIDPLLGPGGGPSISGSKGSIGLFGINIEDQGSITENIATVSQPLVDNYIEPLQRATKRFQIDPQQFLTTPDFWNFAYKPEDRHRANLTLGEVMAGNVGLERNTWGYQAYSGFWDATTYVAFDPITYAGMPMKILNGVRTVPNSLKAATRLGRAFEAARPTLQGRYMTNLGFRGSKNVINRFFYGLLSKQADELVQTAHAQKNFFKPLIDVLLTGKTEDAINEVTRLWPELKRTADTALEILAEVARKTKNPRQVAATYAEVLKGNAWMPRGTRVALDAAGEADAAFEAALRAGLGNKSIKLGNAAGVTAGNITMQGRHMVIAKAAELAGNGIHRLRPKMLDDGAVLMAWTRRPNIFRLGSAQGSFLGKDSSAAARRLRLVLKHSPERAESYINDLTPEGRRQLAELIGRRGGDGLAIGDDILLSPTGKRALIETVDDVADTGMDILGREATNVRKANWLFAQTRNMTDEIWWIDALPKKHGGKSLLGMKEDIFQKLGTNPDNWFKSWATSKLQWATGSLPRKVDFFKTGDGMDSIRRTARRWGINDNDQIDKWLTMYRRAPFEDRPIAVAQIFREMIQDVGDYKTQLSLRKWLSQVDQVVYGLTDDGRDIATGMSKTRGTRQAKPWQTSLLSDGLALPDEIFAKELDRLRLAKNKFVPTATQGIWAGTRKRREKIVQTLRREVQIQQPELLKSGALTDDDLYNIAFSTVADLSGGTVNGLGTVSNFNYSFGKIWKPTQKFFNKVALGTRFATWPLKVVFGEETIRAQMSGLPNMIGSPIRAYGLRKTANMAMAARGTDNVIGAIRVRAVDEVMASVDELVGLGDDTALKRVLKDYGLTDLELTGLETRGAVKREVIKAVEDAFSDYRFSLNGRINIAKDTSRQLKINVRARNRIRAKIGEDVRLQEVLDGMDQVQNKDLFSQVAPHSSATTQDVVSLRTAKREKYVFGRVDELTRELSDASTRRASSRLASSLRGTHPESLRNFVRSSEWDKMRSTVRSISDDAGMKFARDEQLAEWWFDVWYKDNILTPRFKSFLISREARMMDDATIVQLELMAEGNLKVGDDILDLSKHSYSDNNIKYGEWLDDEIGRHGVDNVWEPNNVVAEFEIEKYGENGRLGWRRLPFEVNRALDWSVRTSGTRTTARYTRRPGFVGIFGDEYQRFRDLGWNHQRATAAAGHKAVETINTLMYNMDNAGEMLTKFNQTVPFGAAMKEVAEVWFRILPFHQGAGFFGPIQHLRKIERFMHMLEQIGVARWDEQDDGSRRFILDVSEQTPELGGRLVNSAIHVTDLLGQQLSNVFQLVRGQEADDVPLPTAHRINLGHPLDIGGGGVFGVTRLSVGVQPVASNVGAYIANQTGFLSENVKIVADGDETLHEWAQRNGVEGRSLWDSWQNREKLEKDNPELFRQVMESQDPRAAFEAITWIPQEGLVLDIPNTNPLMEGFDAVFYPFGRPSGDPKQIIQETLMGYTPGSIQAFLRSFAIHEWVGNDQEPGVLGALLGPLNVNKLSTGFLDGMGWDEFRNGTYTSMMANVDLIDDIRTSMLEDGVAILDEDGALVRNLADADPVEVEGIMQGKVGTKDDPRWQQIADLEDDNDELLAEGVVNATSYAMTRDLVAATSGFLVPGTPKGYDNLQRDRETFWDANDVAEAIRNGQGPVAMTEFLNRTHTSPGIAFRSVGVWLNGESEIEDGKFVNKGYSRARRLFDDLMPGIGMFLQPKRAYTGTPFPEYDEFDYTKWIRDIQNGERPNIHGNAFMFRYFYSRVTHEQEIAEAVMFGEDEVLRGINMVNKPLEWGLQKDEFKGKRNALVYYDAELGGHYAELEELQDNDKYGSKEQQEFDEAYSQLTADLADVREQISDVDDLQLDWRDEEEWLSGRQAEARRIQSVLDGFEFMRKEFDYGDKSDDVVEQYFKFVYVPASDRIDRLWKEYYAIDPDDETARKLAQDNIRMAENEIFLSNPTIMGHSVPNMLQYQSRNRTPEDEEERIFRSLSQKPSFLNLQETQAIMARAEAQAESIGADAPGKVLPTTTEEMSAYRWLNREMAKISGYLSAGVDDDGEDFDEGDFRRAKESLEGGLVDFLESKGREDEVTFQEMTPAQQQVTLYMLPPSLDNLFGYSVTWLDELSRVGTEGISPGSYDAEQAFNEDYWPEIKRELQNDMQAVADLEEIGRLLYDTQDWRLIFNQHFLSMWLPFG